MPISHAPYVCVHVLTNVHIRTHAAAAATATATVATTAAATNQGSAAAYAIITDSEIASKRHYVWSGTTAVDQHGFFLCSYLCQVSH